MAKLESSFLNMSLSLTIICIVAGAILAGMSQLTAEPVSVSKRMKLVNAIKVVAPEFDNSPLDESYMAAIAEGDSLRIYPAKKNGALVGAAVESNSIKGFNGIIRVIVGFDAKGKIINYEVLEHSETPGLGDKMDAWFKTDKNKQNILGKDLSRSMLVLSKDQGDVDAITAATISSRAFLDAVNRAYTAFLGKADGYSGATSSDADASSSATTSGENN